MKTQVVKNKEEAQQKALEQSEHALELLRIYEGLPTKAKTKLLMVAYELEEEK